MEKIVLVEAKKVEFIGDSLCFYELNGRLEVFEAYPTERIEPELILNIDTSGPKGIIAEGQWKWQHNCSHLLYDVLSDHFIVKKITGTCKLIHTPTDLSKQILGVLKSEYFPRLKSLDKNESITHQSSFVDNPWRFDGHKHSYITQTIKETLSSIALDDKNFPKNIILYRRVNHGLIRNRNISNVTDLQNKLEASGEKFTLVDLEDFSLYGQIKLFKNANKIISIHGSALVWLNFCNPGITCLEILTPIFKNGNNIKKDFWYMSQQAELNHKTLYSEDIIGDNPRDPHNVDVIVDVNNILELLN